MNAEMVCPAVLSLVLIGVGIWANARAGRRREAGMSASTAIGAAQMNSVAFFGAGLFFGLCIVSLATNTLSSGLFMIAASGVLAIGLGAAGTLRPILRAADGLPPSVGDVDSRGG